MFNHVKNITIVKILHEILEEHPCDNHILFSNYKYDCLSELICFNLTKFKNNSENIKIIDFCIKMGHPWNIKIIENCLSLRYIWTGTSNLEKGIMKHIKKQIVSNQQLTRVYAYNSDDDSDDLSDDEDNKDNNKTNLINENIFKRSITSSDDKFSQIRITNNTDDETKKIY